MSHVPLQNRVDPWGKLHAVPTRGALMGNRGILHNEARKVVRPWARKPWVTCVLSFGNVKRTPFSPGNYSELFFLDEVTSLAAGHRPCKTCQRDRHIEFKEAWLQANAEAKDSSFVPISEIDQALHSERAMRGGEKLTFEAKYVDLPVGTMFEHEASAFLVWRHGPLRWSFSGYSAAPYMPREDTVHVLTPKSIVRMFDHGFQPIAHQSADEFVV